ncbi:hypothetical protein H0W32_01895 [Patescibacteria group bacterium]|nr:hypothetical protein [Patescibacteria group bacterium]
MDDAGEDFVRVAVLIGKVGEEAGGGGGGEEGEEVKFSKMFLNLLCC